MVKKLLSYSGGQDDSGSLAAATPSVLIRLYDFVALMWEGKKENSSKVEHMP
jgi:hypothetical protein